ncbi:unnamed protein product [Ilex paraguariensis]|uniref:Uncharacterized protein n=1 Tax=Ilex paraguariensis TaxID=185542 RepID=A0ABC8SW21_9AQUA
MGVGGHGAFGVVELEGGEVETETRTLLATAVVSTRGDGRARASWGWASRPWVLIVPRACSLRGLLQSMVLVHKEEAGVQDR